MRAQLDHLWDLTPETYAHRAEIRRRHAEHRRRQSRREWLLVILFLIAASGMAILADLAHGWIH
jgi:hypothetical protein